jgi:hypothetical protein
MIMVLTIETVLLDQIENQLSDYGIAREERSETFSSEKIHANTNSSLSSFST